MAHHKDSKFAWITGASRGIGLATAEEFLSNGWNVVVLTRNIAPLAELKAIYTSQLYLVAFDVTHSDTALLPDYPVDVLLNNAGTIVNKAFEDITQRELEYSYQTNVFGPFLLIQALMKRFTPTAHIINISSIGGVQGSVKFPGLTSYSSSKGALVVLTECLQCEFQETQWSFNCLALGAVQTEMLESAFPGYKAKVTSKDLSPYIFNFATTAHQVMKGKVIPVSLSTP
jgi:NAD(P)-dependent dehydrogenase (short-subunit alcohol dehydrogenase family)